MSKKFGIFFVTALIIFSSLYLFLINCLPASFSIIKGNESTILSKTPFSIEIVSNSSSLYINGKEPDSKDFKLESGKQITVMGKAVGKSLIDFKLFGIPIKSITVNVLPDIDVYPGGQAIGVLLRSKGVMVVGNSFVEGKNGKKFFPAQESGISVGDKILKINGVEINDKIKLASLIQDYAENNQEIVLDIMKKNRQIKSIKVNPIKNKNGIYMIGIYVDDGVAGVGTLTFYEITDLDYGALGHKIIETSSNTGIEVRTGKILQAQISGINSGIRGTPGEKVGTFFQTENVIGDILDNNEFGIYGKLNKQLKNPYFKEPIPVATISEVERGPAKIYTVVNGGKIEEYNINIDKVYNQSYPREKGIIISITDPALRKLTGGIIQGMSGSPIVQNNKLVGAVTHVFVNEPTKGYGVFAEWMLLKTSIYDRARAK
ncbi:MAG: SpoIVB peptidase [Halanaerobiales bacterium]